MEVWNDSKSQARRSPKRLGPLLWDHPMPNDTNRFDQFMESFADDATRKQIPVDDPAALYGFE